MRIRTNSSGSALTIFLVIIILFSMSLSGTLFFFLQKEAKQRKDLEDVLDDLKRDQSRLEIDLQDAVKQGFLLQKEKRDAEEKINGLTKELKLAETAREELKLENSLLKGQLEKDKTGEEIQEEKEEIQGEKKEIQEEGMTSLPG